MKIDIDNAIRRALTARPTATLDDIRLLVPPARDVPDHELRERVERIRRQIP